jgi:anti-sigma regulatory factor (Ser/Thr protein kinase)
VVLSRIPFEHRFAPRVAELPMARRVLREWLDASGHDGDQLQELLVVATELCTEAVRSSFAGLVTLRAWEDDAGVVVEVESLDGANGRASVQAAGDPLDEAVRGMVIVRALCDEVTIMVRGANRFVRCRKQIGASPAYG